MDEPRGFPVLRWPAVLAILGVAVVVFLFFPAPIWSARASWNEAIGYSYLLIPFLVAGALAVKKDLRWLPWMLHTIQVAALKFVITASVLLGLLMTGHHYRPVVDAPAVEPAQVAVAPRAAPRVTAADPRGGRVTGQVRDASGRPLAGALVYAESSAWPRQATPPQTPVTVANDGAGPVPEIPVVLVGQPLVLRAGDHQLHTVRAERRSDRRWEFNVPVPASGLGPPRAFEHTGEMDLVCTVHKTERHGSVMVLDAPFFAHTDAQGRFALEGIPPGSVQVDFVAPNGARSQRDLSLTDGQSVEVTVTAG